MPKKYTERKSAFVCLEKWCPKNVYTPISCKMQTDDEYKAHRKSGAEERGRENDDGVLSRKIITIWQFLGKEKHEKYLKKQTESINEIYEHIIKKNLENEKLINYLNFPSNFSKSSCSTC